MGHYTDTATATATVDTRVRQPHAVCVPYPAQGHINPMLKLAKLLHHKGFHITFVNTDYNHRRLLKSHGGDAVAGLPHFRFASIPDGLPPNDADVTQDIPSLCRSTTTTCLEPFCDLLLDLDKNKSIPPVSCIISDAVMSFTLKAAERFRLPEICLWTASACGLLAYVQYRRLLHDGVIPLKDMEQVTNGYLETEVELIPAGRSKKFLRLRDLPSFLRTTNPEDFMVGFILQEVEALRRAKGIIFNTFDDLEEESLSALSEFYPPEIYAVGPLNLRMNSLPENGVKALESSLWVEDHECIKWLDTKAPGSVVYVNFGSITVVTAAQLTEFAWGLADSGHTFLWVIRPDIVSGESAMLPEEFVAETRDRGLMINWCPQEEVLGHAAVGGFLTHCGWNSTVESISSGVAVICWPFFAEQQTNCRYSCVDWGIGMEIDDVKRGEVEKLVRELMTGEKGCKMKEMAVEWRRKAEAAVAPGGSSEVNLNRLINQVLLAL